MRLREKEVSILELSAQELGQLATTDIYFSTEQIFNVLGLDVIVNSECIATALNNLPQQKRDIIEIKRMVEKAKQLKAAREKKDEFGDCSKYVTFKATDKKGVATDGKVTASLNKTAILEDSKLAGYNLFVTSETNVRAEEIHATYRNLWRVEE